MNRLKSFLRPLINRVNPIQDKQVRDLTKISHLPGDYDRVYHIHVRKTGGTSLNYAFFGIDGADPEAVYQNLVKNLLHRVVVQDKVFIGWNKEFINQGHYFFAYSHLPIYELELPPRTFTVTCFRDPVQRVLSHYNMLVEYETLNVDHPLRRTECRWLGRGFSDFLERIPRQHLMNQLYMFSPSFDVEEAIERIGHCSMYFFTEAFSEGIDEINSRLNLELKQLVIRKTNRKYINVNDDEISRLREILEPEYRLLDRLRRDNAS